MAVYNGTEAPCIRRKMTSGAKPNNDWALFIALLTMLLISPNGFPSIIVGGWVGTPMPRDLNPLMISLVNLSSAGFKVWEKRISAHDLIVDGYIHC